jgi:prepilin peptidase CpaA
MTTALPSILLGLLAAMLLAAAALDLRSRTIPNGLNLAIALLALPYYWAVGLALWPDVALQLGVAILVFAAFAGVFALGAMGGGDVKLVAAVALWLPWPGVIALLVLMSLAGGALTLAMVVRQRISRPESALEIPYGVAIAFGGLWLIGQRFLYQFG